MGVTCEHHDLMVGVAVGKVADDSAGCAANEKWPPFRPRKRSRAGQCLDKRRHVGGNHNPWCDGGSPLEQGAQTAGICVGQRLLDGEASCPRGLGGELADEPVIVQTKRGRQGIPVAAVSPAIDPDQHQSFCQRNHPGGRQPLDVGAALGEGEHIIPDRGHRGAEMVVIAKDVVDRPPGCVRDGLEVGGQASGVRGVAGQDDRVTRRVAYGVEESRLNSRGGVVEVGIGDPGEHGHVQR